MTAHEVVVVLDRLDRAGVEWWIDGGWGLDALLGEETRGHDDLDLAVRLDDVERLPSVFPEFRRVDEEQWPGAFVLRDSAGRQLDFHPLEFDAGGHGWQTQPDGSRHRWPREALAARGRIAGREVRCTSAEFQLDSHLYAGHDDVDWEDARLLCERFGLPAPPALAERPGFVHRRRRLSSRAVAVRADRAADADGRAGRARTC